MSEDNAEVKSKELRLYRQGLSYRIMSADNTVCHNSDIRQLLAGAIIIKCFRKYAYEQISRLVEHDYEDIRYKTLDGKIHEGYFPFAGQPGIIDVVPGTHASGSFLAYLAFNKYVLDAPLYREMYRLSGESMRLSRMSLTNWLEKGSVHFCGLITYLKNSCLEKDSIVNCDETLWRLPLWYTSKLNANFEVRFQRGGYSKMTTYILFIEIWNLFIHMESSL